jgi:hypothetical protein
MNLSICEQCGEDYMTYNAWLKKSKHHLCGKECLRRWRSNWNKINGFKPPGFQKGVPLGRDISGDKNPNWRGGKTLEGQLLRTTNAYKIWRTAVYSRDNYTCVWCRVKGNGKNLNADHIKPFWSHPELRLEVSNGRTLCVDCHKKTGTWGRPPKKCVSAVL